ncbi:MAG: flavin reductase family protein [Calditrichia bacterium]
MSQNLKSYSRHLVHPVTLISCSDGKKENIATMAWVSAVSSDPPLLMVAVSPKRFSHDLILSSGEFAILVLSNLQKELATVAGIVHTEFNPDVQPLILFNHRYFNPGQFIADYP